MRVDRELFRAQRGAGELHVHHAEHDAVDALNIVVTPQMPRASTTTASAQKDFSQASDAFELIRFPVVVTAFCEQESRWWPAP